MKKGPGRVDQFYVTYLNDSIPFNYELRLP